MICDMKKKREDELENVFLSVDGEVLSFDEVLRRIREARDGGKKRRFSTG